MRTRRCFANGARLKGWLEPERTRLEALRSLQTDALTWDRNGRDAAFLNHRDKRLAETAALAGIEAYRKRLGAVEFDYLAACHAAERLARRRARRSAVARGRAGLRHRRGSRRLDQSSPTCKEQINWFMTMRPYMLASVRPYVLTAEAERALKPGASFRECAKDCPEMIVVPAGELHDGIARD